MNYPNDQEIDKIDRIIQGLIKGDKSFDLPKIKNQNFQDKINIVEEKLQNLKVGIIAFRQGKIT